MLVFHRSTRETLSFLANSRSESQIDVMFEQCLRFLRSQNKALARYELMSTQELIRTLHKIVGHQTTTDSSAGPSASPSALKTRAFEEVVQKVANNYVVTPDNFLKMVRIAQKAEARIPVVLMGETGCGKTSLVQMLAQILGVEFR